jgi:hypothetical protein
MASRIGRLIRCCAALALAVAVPAHAQRITLESLSDLELWKTDDSSRLLARNGGDPAILARFRLWASWRLAPTVELRAVGFVEGGNAESDNVYAAVELLSLRWFPSRAFTVEAGKVLMPLGAFGARRFSNTNPLVGDPDLYPTEYPFGVVVSGATGIVDYRVGAISLGVVNTRYTPEPGHAIRPVVGLGVSAGPSFHIGTSLTRGPYLSDNETPLLPNSVNRSWDQYLQTVAASDARFSYGYLDARAELAWSWYEVPTMATEVRGFGWYGELTWTLTPRLFVSTRYEDNQYPFVLPINKFFWVGTATTQKNGELGVGYRIGPDLLVKTSYRRDHWPVRVAGGISFPDGYSFGMQLSWHANLMEMFEPKY